MNVLFEIAGWIFSFVEIHVVCLLNKNTMFTFKSQQRDPVFWIGEKPVYTSFQKDEKDRIPPFRDSSTYLHSGEFLEKYNLNRTEGKLLADALSKDVVPEDHLKTKFYKIRKDPKTVHRNRLAGNKA